MSLNSVSFLASIMPWGTGTFPCSVRLFSVSALPSLDPGTIFSRGCLSETYCLTQNSLMRQLGINSITDPTDMNLSKIQDIVEDRGAWCAIVHESMRLQSQTGFSDWITTMTWDLLVTSMGSGGTEPDFHSHPHHPQLSVLRQVLKVPWVSFLMGKMETIISKGHFRVCWGNIHKHPLVPSTL